MSKKDLEEPCYDCGGLNASRRLHKVNGVGQFVYECTCRDCGAKWREEEDVDEFGHAK
jgi:hypothetical protein